MDTPEKTQIATPLSKFEDSPVFNYINSLSPIKPVKSIHITQPFSSLCFASLPSVFTSPHVSCHKESRFLRSLNNSDPSKPKGSPENGNNDCDNEGAVTDAGQLYDNSTEGVSVGGASIYQPSEHLKFAIELPRTLTYDCGSPDCDPSPHCCFETDSRTELGSTSALLVPFVQDSTEKGSVEGEAKLQPMCQIEERNEGTGCDWENLISDASDLLIFNSPNETEAFKGLIQKSLNPETTFCTSPIPHFPQNGADPSRSSEQHETEEPHTRPGETSDLERMNQLQDKPDNNDPNTCMAANTIEKLNNEPASNLYRGMRRRCLDFEMVGACRKTSNDGSNCTSILLPSDKIVDSKDKQLVPFRAGSDSSKCILPGIGLHLNALAINSKDGKIVKLETFSGGQLSLPPTAASFHSPSAGQEHLNDSLTLEASEKYMNPTESGVQLADDASQASTYLVGEEFNQNSPKRKKRRMEQAGESESCKRCNCKKSKCLKLYCECFAAGVYCIEPCSCQDCINKPIHEDTVLATRKQIESRNPLAFAPKVIRSSESIPEIGDDSSKTPASARHKRGCNCKKSSCLKKYCECYQGGVGCSINCRCEGCKNAFGRKDGSLLLGAETEQGDDTEICEKSQVDKTLQKIDVETNEEQNPSSTLPATPLRFCRPFVQLPFSSKGKPPRSFLGSSSALYTGQKYGKPNILRPRSKFEKQRPTVQEDELPDILISNCSPSPGIKSVSPNSKRVSPPHCDLGSSPGRRSGRKLILQSIPSFPSLTPQH